MQKLPIGIQTFKDIREEDLLYIDKTEDAYKLIDGNGKYFFLSRPRRFGKSLFLDTLKNIFEGKKEYFQDLYIYDKWDWDVKYPVLKLSFSGNRNTKELINNIYKNISYMKKELDIECEINDDYAMCFAELIEIAYEKYNQKVVILIDEYDKPILDNLDQMEVAKECREILKRLYSQLKDNDRYIKFAFLTGVSKFSRASIFSGLNMLTDISLNPRFGNICGYTQNDVETKFLPYLDGVDLERLKNFYNGYNFLKDDIYNPFDILQFIANDKVFDNYWFITGTPTFLIKLIEKNNYFLPNLSNLTVDKKLLDSFDIENLDLEVILYQSGYLTIDEMNEKRRGGVEYKLKLPNVEVKQSLNDTILDYLTKQKTQKLQYQDFLYDALCAGDLESFKNTLFSLFESIPYNNFTNNDIQNFEGFYASVIYTYLQSLGIRIIGEDVTNKGRIDLTCFIEDKIYIIEFKVDAKKEGEALEQIKNKKYTQKYLTQGDEIYLVGIEFNSDERNIGFFEWESI
ncbi:MAG: ATP-binding protein [Campylobacterota bacterium]|nr:ATP-binding protein [Campylobacterota bacterium]